MTDFSKVFGPTDSVAATKTTVGAAASLRPTACTIKEIYVAKGNVVNAKENAGYITIEAPGLDGPHHYAYGGGVGGATNSHTGPAEKIDCSIPIGANVLVTVSVTDGEAAKNVTVSLGFDKGLGRNVHSYCVGGPAADTAAATEKQLLDVITGVAAKIGKTGKIKEIRYAGSGVVDADANSAKIVIEMPVIKGPWEFATGNGSSGATLGGPAHADVRDTNIPAKAGDTVIVKITSAEIQLTPTLSFQVV